MHLIKMLFLLTMFVLGMVAVFTHYTPLFMLVLVALVAFIIMQELNSI